MKILQRAFTLFTDRGKMSNRIFVGKLIDIDNKRKNLAWFLNDEQAVLSKLS